MAGGWGANDLPTLDTLVSKFSTSMLWTAGGNPKMMK